MNKIGLAYTMSVADKHTFVHFKDKSVIGAR